MATHRLRVSEIVYYEVSIEAPTKKDAVKLLRQKLRAEDGSAEELDLTEVDNSGLEYVPD